MIGIAGGDLLDERRRHPGMEVGADLGLAGVAQRREEAHRRRVGRDRIVDDIGGDDAEAVVQSVGAGLGRDRAGRNACPREGLRPVELLLGVDDDQQLGGHSFLPLSAAEAVSSAAAERPDRGAARALERTVTRTIARRSVHRLSIIG